MPKAVNNMSLDAIIPEIEKLLQNKNYDKALEIVESVKKDNNYRNDEKAHYIDHSLGQVMLRRKKKFTLDEINEIIKIFDSALRLYCNSLEKTRTIFAENHLMLGQAYAYKSNLTDEIMDASQALYFFDKFSKEKPEFAWLCEPDMKRLKNKFSLR